MSWYDFRSSNCVNLEMCVCQNIQYCTESINKHTQLGCNLIKCNKIQRMTNAQTATTKYNVLNPNHQTETQNLLVSHFMTTLNLKNYVFVIWNSKCKFGTGHSIEL